MSKRSNGEGSVTQRADGRWMVRVTDPTTGKRRAAYFRTEGEARRAVARMMVKAERGEVVLAKGATLRTWVAEWLPERAGRRRRESTVAAYAYRLRTYVLPEVGGVRLRELTPLVVDDLAHALVRRGLSHSTVKGCLVALSACLADAQRGRLIDSNPAAGVEVPEQAQRTGEVVPPTVEQVQAVLAAVDGTDLAPLVTLLATTGARIGEALGAQWSDLDLERGTWLVGRTVTLSVAGEVRLGSRTKTGDARRLTLTAETVALLRRQRRTVAELRLAAGPLWQEHDLVFPSSVGTPQHSQNVRAAFRPVATAAGWPGSFHSFRHFVASVGLSALPSTVVAKQLGHRRASLTTDVYGHLLADDSATVAALVSRLVSTEESAR
jgi:integrase